MIRTLTIGCLVLFVACSAHSSRVQAVDCTFSRIADTSGSIASWPAFWLSMNNHGDVAFTANLDSGDRAIYLYHDGTLAPVVEFGTEFFFLNTFPSINDARDIAFIAGLVSGGNGVFKQGASGITPIVQGTTSYGVFASINDLGDVTFTEFNGVDSIRVGNGGPLETIADSNDGIGRIGNAPRINNAGQVAFEAGGTIHRGAGGPLTTIAQNDGPFNPFSQVVSINDAGTVALLTRIDSIEGAIVLGDGGPLVPIIDSTGPLAPSLGTTPSLNNHGELAFYGAFDTGEPVIFVGPDLVDDLVITHGDPLDGSTVVSLITSSDEFFNDRRQVVFYAELADGREGVYRGSPVPEPSAGMITMIAVAIMCVMRTRRRDSTHEGRMDLSV